MSEIATTARIRELFTDGGFWNSDVFDEWLEQHDAEVARDTEARIIKLLEANCNCHTAMVRGYVKKFVCPAHGFIARIEASQKDN